MGRTILAICGAVLALGLMASASSPQGKAGEKALQPGQTPQASGPQTPAPRADDPERLYAACAQDEVNRNSDLCAQWYAADQAKEAATWTRRTGWLNVVGLVIGAATMAAAICAAIFAKEAASHTRAQVRIAKRTMRAQLRAYMTTTDIDSPVVFEGKKVRFRVNARNSGVTPARNIVPRIYLDVSPDPDSFVFEEAELWGGQSNSVVGGGDPYRIPIDTKNVMTEQVIRYVADKGSIIIYGSIRYDDIFGRSHKTEFAYFSRGFNEDGCLEFASHARHSEAT